MILRNFDLLKQKQNNIAVCIRLLFFLNLQFFLLIINAIICNYLVVLLFYLLSLFIYININQTYLKQAYQGH